MKLVNYEIRNVNIGCDCCCVWAAAALYKIYYNSTAIDMVTTEHDLWYYNTHRAGDTHITSSIICVVGALRNIVSNHLVVVVRQLGTYVIWKISAILLLIF